MSFTIKFSSQKEHDDYIKFQAEKMGLSEEKIVSASELMEKRTYKKKLENNYKPWKEEDDQFIVDNFGTLKAKKIANKLGRTPMGVAARIVVLRQLGKNLPLKRAAYNKKQLDPLDPIL